MADSSATSHRVTIDDISYFITLRRANNAPLGKPPVLLIHALMANQHMWDSAARTLNAAGYNTLQTDNIGHGHTTVPTSLDSSAQAPAFHFDTMTRHFHAVVKSITGQEKVEAVIGCSMGGVLTLRYGLLFPDSVINCLICCDAPGPRIPETAKAMWADRIDVFRRDLAEGTEVLMNATVERWIPGTDEESVRARVQALDMVRTCSLDGYRVCVDGVRSYDYQALLGSLKTRTMILAGADDKSIGPPEVTESTAEAIPGANLVWMERTGHMPPIHRPKEFEKIVLDFLAQKSS